MQIVKYLIIGLSATALCGCATTTITETQYAEDGSTVVSQKVSETSGNPFVILAQNSAQKSWVIHNGGWAAVVGVEPSSEAYGIKVASFDTTISSVLDSQNAVEVAKSQPAIISASKYELSVSKDGVSSQNSDKTGE